MTRPTGYPPHRPVTLRVVGSLAPMTDLPFRHPEFEVNSDDPFKHDKVGREAFVRELCSRIMAQEQAAVVAITGGFGTGKSVVLQMCSAVLRDQGATVTEFNAWQQSHSRNPLIDLVSALSRERHEIWKGVLKVALRLSSSLVTGMTGLPVALDRLVDSEDGTSSDPFKAWAALEEGVNDFKKAVVELVEDTESRFVVVIDELDRCVPDYAMGLLNVARHLFDVPGVVIVLGVNRTELGHRVRQVYGEKCDADAYLYRFVDLPIELPRLDRYRLDRYTTDVVASTGGAQHSTVFTSVLELLLEEAHASLRDTEQIARRVAQMLPVVRQSGRFSLAGLAAMLVLRIVDRDSYEEFAAGRKSGIEAVVALRAQFPQESDPTSQRASTLHRVEVQLLNFGDSRGLSAIDLDPTAFCERWVKAGLGDDASAATVHEGLARTVRLEPPSRARDLADFIETVISLEPGH